MIAREILDSRGNPTIEADVIVSGHVFRGMVPSGASTGEHEAVELRDSGKKYQGKGVTKAVKNVNTLIRKKLIGLDCRKQTDIDQAMISLDSDPNKKNIGANAMLGVSLAVCRAGAGLSGKPLFSYLSELSGNKQMFLPHPFLNVINGAKHAGMENDIQEHMIVPTKRKSFSELLRVATETYHVLKSMLKAKYGARAVLLGDEGGFVMPEKNLNKRLDFILHAIAEAGYENEISLAIDCAASEYFYKTHYMLGEKKFSSEKLTDYYLDLLKTYPIISIEDPFSEEDWSAWSALQKKLPSSSQLVSDDLVCTNPARIQKGIDVSACNALLLKVNQIGTLSEAIDAWKLAKNNNWNTMVSHRSGETEDSFISDLVVGLGCGQSKFGAPARSERVAKYNQLLRIEEKLGSKAKVRSNVI